MGRDSILQKSMSRSVKHAKAWWFVCLFVGLVVGWLVVWLFSRGCRCHAGEWGL